MKLTTRPTLIKGTIIVIAVALIAASMYVSFAAGQTVTSTTTQSEHTLIVAGTGVVKLSPNEAQISLGALTQSPSLADATAQNAKIVNDLLNLLHGTGVTDDMISTEYFNINPIYNYSKYTSQPIVIGYQVTHQLQVTLQNSNLSQLASKVGQVIDLAVGVGVNEVNGVQFTVSDQSMKTANNQALHDAITDASSKAQIMTDALGVKILGVQTVVESAPNYSPPIYYAGAGATDKGTQILPGTYSVSTTVQVTFLIE